MSARLAAHRILSRVRDGAFAEQAAEGVLSRLPPADRGLAQEIAYGCLRLRGRLDTWIQAFTDRPLGRVDEDVLDWLRIGTYQLRELRIPDHAAVGETVRGARRAMDRGRAGFINAVLRAMADDPEADPFPSRDTDPVGYLTTWGSHPEWLVRRWLDRWGYHAVWRLVQHDNAPPGVVLRLLGDEPPTPPAGVEVAPTAGWPGSYRLLRGSPGEALAGLHAVVQDPAASAVVDYMGPEVDAPRLDVCAAPGTKALVLSARAGTVFAMDVSRVRTKRAAVAVRRVGLPIHLAVADARRPAVRSARTVLADAPCTGTGVLRRRVDSRWRVDEARLASLTRLQGEILDASAALVEEGGLLVYATCSLELEENEEQVSRFLERSGAFEREAPPSGCVREDAVTADGDLFVRPWLTGTDGAYAARLRRVS